MTTEAADPVDAVAVSPAADPGFLQRYGATIEYILIPGAARVRVFCQENQVPNAPWYM